MKGIAVTLLTLATLTQANLYTSLHHVDQLFLFDQSVGLALIKLSSDDYYCTRYIESYTAVVYDSARYGGSVLGDRVAGNPLHIYQLFKRLVNFWPSVKDIFLKTITNDSIAKEEQNVMQDIVTKAETLTIPNTLDLEGAANALARLARTYRIPQAQFCDGGFYDLQSSVKLDFEDCMTIGDMSIIGGFIADGLQWFEHCSILSNGGEQKRIVNEKIEEIIVLHDKEWIKDNSKYFPKLLSEERNQITWDEIYYQLCRGHRLLEEDERSKLTCYTSHQGSPFLQLQPVKVEVLKKSPKIFIFHDVISDKEIEDLKAYSTDKLSRSQIQGEAARDTRVSMTSWLSENDFTLVERLSRRISDVTGLATHEGTFQDMAGESLQVLSYGVGGHYHYHFDYLFKFKPEEEWHLEPDNLKIPGERLATWMFYLSHVPLGGNTAFVRGRVSTNPVKGSAVFWYNLDPDGNGDPLTEHGGCPVLLGSKWVANKWIREKANFQRYPCPAKN